jgi:hypothetical protein
VEVFAVLRLLWHQRRLVLLGAILAAVAAYVFGPSPSPPRGVASTRILLDTSRSQLVADEPDDVAETLAWRATLAAQVLATDNNRRAIASAAGIPPERLDVTDLELMFPVIPASLPRTAAKASLSAPTQPFALSLHTDDAVPIISITAFAPDRASAVRLTEAAVTTLRRYASGTPSAEVLGLAVQTVTRIDSVTIPSRRNRKKTAAIAVVVFGLWIAALTLGPALLGPLRTALRDGDAVHSPALPGRNRRL